MRYYVYMDKDLIKNLIATYSNGNFDFNIDFVEYSIQKNCGNVNNIRVDPRNEKISDDEKSKCSKRKSNSISLDAGTTFNTIIEQKYINISDISDIKNINFYHKLIEKLRDLKIDNTREDDKIKEEKGKIIKLRNEFYGKDKIFSINNSYIWYDEEKCLIDFNFFTNMSGEVMVIGYNIKETKDRNSEMLKAIAIYLE